MACLPTRCTILLATKALRLTESILFRTVCPVFLDLRVRVVMRKLQLCVALMTVLILLAPNRGPLMSCVIESMLLAVATPTRLEFLPQCRCMVLCVLLGLPTMLLVGFGAFTRCRPMLPAGLVRLLAAVTDPFEANMCGLCMRFRPTVPCSETDRLLWLLRLCIAAKLVTSAVLVQLMSCSVKLVGPSWKFLVQFRGPARTARRARTLTRFGR